MKIRWNWLLYATHLIDIHLNIAKVFEVGYMCERWKFEYSVRVNDASQCPGELVKLIVSKKR